MKESETVLVLFVCDCMLKKDLPILVQIPLFLGKGVGLKTKVSLYPSEMTTYLLVFGGTELTK